MNEYTKTTALRNVTAVVGDLTSEPDVITTLTLLKELHDWISAAQTTAVGRAMAQGHTHRDIGIALGVSQQAISKRYGCGKGDDPKGASASRQKTASKTTALVHFTPDGDYVGYSLSIEVEDLASAAGSPTQGDDRPPAADAVHQEPWNSDVEAAVAEIAASPVGHQPGL